MSDFKLTSNIILDTDGKEITGERVVLVSSDTSEITINAQFVYKNNEWKLENPELYIYSNANNDNILKIDYDDLLSSMNEINGCINSTSKSFSIEYEEFNKAYWKTFQMNNDYVHGLINIKYDLILVGTYKALFTLKEDSFSSILESIIKLPNYLNALHNINKPIFNTYEIKESNDQELDQELDKINSELEFDKDISEETNHKPEPELYF